MSNWHENGLAYEHYKRVPAKVKFSVKCPNNVTYTLYSPAYAEDVVPPIKTTIGLRKIVDAAREA